MPNSPALNTPTTEGRERRTHGAAFVESRATLDDLDIVVKRFGGPVGGRDYVLVHGIGVSSRYYHPLAAELATTGTVWVIDLPGYGSAPKPGRDVSIDGHAAILGRFLDANGIDNPVLVGHSMGCQVVTALAAGRPRLSDQLVLLAPTINPAERRVWRQAFNLGRDLFVEPVRSNAVVMTDYIFRCGPAYYLKQLPHMMDDHIEDRLPGIPTRTLVVVGRKDPVVPIEWAGRVANLLPRGTLAVVGGPHVIMYTDPRAIRDLILEHGEGA
ncbi:MAG: putative hydrolase [Microbacteriaceae bacterium]|nr:putative hydrolase [Microbacteriaceae bacterium]